MEQSIWQQLALKWQLAGCLDTNARAYEGCDGIHMEFMESMAHGMKATRC